MKFDLSLVKAIAEYFLKGKHSAIYFSAKSQSTDAVVRVFLCRSEEAEVIIAQGLLHIDLSDFNRLVIQWGEVYDEYGLENYQGHSGPEPLSYQCKNNEESPLM